MEVSLTALNLTLWVRDRPVLLATPGADAGVATPPRFVAPGGRFSVQCRFQAYPAANISVNTVQFS